MPEWPQGTDGQLLEGQHYYGAGVLLLIVVAVAIRWRQGRPAPAVFPWPLRLVLVLMAAVAVSPRVTLGAHVVIDATGPWAAPLALFRSTGRFLWPLSYAVLVWMVATLVRRASPLTATALLAFGLVVQAYDLADFHADRRRTGHDPAFYTWQNPFVSSRWGRIARYFDHLVLGPPPQCGGLPLPTEPALWFGTTYGLTVNAGTLSRGSDTTRAGYCRQLQDQLSSGRLDPAAIYLVPAGDAARIEAAPGGPALRAARRPDAVHGRGALPGVAALRVGALKLVACTG